MKMRKLMFLLLAALMIVGLMAGTAAAADPVTITYSFWGTPDEAASVQAVADRFHEEYPEIIVEVMAIPNGEYTTKLNTLAAAGQRRWKGSGRSA